MSQRNFSMDAYWNYKAQNMKPLLTFDGETKQDWDKWSQAANTKLIEILGDLPDKVELNAEVEYSVEDGDLIRERVVFDTEEFMSVPCIVLRPKDMKPDGKNPAILCANGHPAHLGKDPVAGVRSSDEHDAQIRIKNYNYGEQMAKRGYFAIMPEWRGFGERRDGANPFPGRDACNVNFIKGAIMGLYMLSLNIWDAMRTIDYLETRPEVDPNRIGMMGLSYGGTMTTFTTAVDKRIKAADIMGYVNPWKAFAIKQSNFCGVQMLPEVYKYFDTFDIAGLIAPRPLLVEMGMYDDCFFIQELLKGYAGIENIYKKAGAEDKVFADIHPNPHRFAGNMAFDFFDKHL